MPFFAKKKGAITPSTSERTALNYAVAQVHMLINRLIKFHHCSMYTPWVTRNASPQMYFFLAEKRAKTLPMSEITARKYAGA